jgi:hypothetical protein
MNLKDITPIKITPVDQLSAWEATSKRVRYCVVKIICRVINIKSPIIVYSINGIICEIKRRVLFLEPRSVFIFLILCRIAPLPERIAIPTIVENKTILVSSDRDRLTIEDTSLSKESTSNAAIKIMMVREENFISYQALAYPIVYTIINRM